MARIGKSRHRLSLGIDPPNPWILFVIFGRLLQIYFVPDLVTPTQGISPMAYLAMYHKVVMFDVYVIGLFLRPAPARDWIFGLNALGLYFS